MTYTEANEQYCTKITIKNGSQTAYVSIFNTGSINVGGKNSPLKELLEKMKDAIATENTIPGQTLPFEIDNFPETIKTRVPDCDPVIVAFIAEAIQCFRSEAIIASAFMLGAASEKAINLLIYAYADSITDDSKKQKFLSRVNNRMISIKYKEFENSYKSCKSRPVDPVISQDLEVLIGTIFQFCRVTRNEIGHPQIVPDLDKGVLLANLGCFVTYIERIYRLMKHFSENGVEI